MVVVPTACRRHIVSRTSADLGHHESWTERILEPGTWYTLRWEINADDRVFEAGHVLGVVITAERHNPTAPYQPVTATIKTKRSWIAMPVSGEVPSLTYAGDVAPIVTTSITPEQPTRDLDEFVREFFEGSR